MNTMTLDSNLYARLIRGGAANLNQNRSIVNDLNVFPIPDGDTGDNMFMTVDAGKLSESDCEQRSLSEVSAKIADGMLLGARGNSGVILSRIFAGIAKGFDGVDKADLKTVAKAFDLGIHEAYSAVSVPVEGTILTVYKDAVTYANGKLSDTSSLENYIDDLLAELEKSLDRTPDLLPVLREAGVVDSGGAGFVYIAEGMKKVLAGESIVETDEGPAKVTTDLSKFGEDSVLEFGYCTEFLLRLQNSKVDVGHFDESVIAEYLGSVGDSVVFFRDGSIIKAHVHTMHPGEILNHCQKYGEFLTLKIENMTLQHSEANTENRYSKKPHKAYGTVVVGSGEGIRETFLSLGADMVVEGGQCSNPSAADFVEAFRKIDADTIFVFPNNGNVILTARQAAAMYDGADIRVIESKTLGQGYAALSMLDTSADTVDEIIEGINASMEGVITGSISRANRSTEMNGVTIEDGDYIGFAGDTIYVAGKSRKDTLLALAESLRAERYDVAILVCGKDADEAETSEVYKTLSNTYKRTEIISIDGGQPVYDYLLILE